MVWSLIELKKQIEYEVNAERKTIKQQNNTTSKKTTQIYYKDADELENSKNHNKEEISLKLYELMKCPSFDEAILKLDYNTAMIMLLKIKYPNKTLDEISTFLGKSKKEVMFLLETGVNSLKSSLDELINNIFSNYKDAEDKDFIIKKDNI